MNGRAANSCDYGSESGWRCTGGEGLRQKTGEVPGRSKCRRHREHFPIPQKQARKWPAVVIQKHYSHHCPQQVRKTSILKRMDDGVLAPKPETSSQMTTPSSRRAAATIQPRTPG